MLRRISLITASAAMVTLSALPASAAVMQSPAHKLSFPALSGVSASGTYTKTSRGVKVSVCVKDTARANYAVAADVEALNASRKSSSEVGAVSLGYNQTVCRSMTLHYTSHLQVTEFTVNSKGQVAKRSKVKNIY
jgi:hypothetical protein